MYSNNPASFGPDAVTGLGPRYSGATQPLGAPVENAVDVFARPSGQSVHDNTSPRDPGAARLQTELQHVAATGSCAAPRHASGSTDVWGAYPYQAESPGMNFAVSGSAAQTSSGLGRSSGLTTLGSLGDGRSDGSLCPSAAAPSAQVGGNCSASFGRSSPGGHMFASVRTASHSPLRSPPVRSELTAPTPPGAASVSSPHLQAYQQPQPPQQQQPDHDQPQAVPEANYEAQPPADMVCEPMQVEGTPAPEPTNGGQQHDCYSNRSLSLGGNDPDQDLLDQLLGREPSNGGVGDPAAAGASPQAALQGQLPPHLQADPFAGASVQPALSGYSPRPSPQLPEAEADSTPGMALLNAYSEPLPFSAPRPHHLSLHPVPMQPAATGLAMRPGAGAYRMEPEASGHPGGSAQQPTSPHPQPHHNHQPQQMHSLPAANAHSQHSQHHPHSPGHPPQPFLHPPQPSASPQKRPSAERRSAGQPSRLARSFAVSQPAPVDELLPAAYSEPVPGCDGVAAWAPGPARTSAISQLGGPGQPGTPRHDPSLDPMDAAGSPAVRRRTGSNGGSIAVCPSPSQPGGGPSCFAPSYDQLGKRPRQQGADGGGASATAGLGCSGPYDAAMRPQQQPPGMNGDAGPRAGDTGSTAGAAGSAQPRRTVSPRSQGGDRGSAAAGDPMSTAPDPNTHYGQDPYAYYPYGAPPPPSYYSGVGPPSSYPYPYPYHSYYDPVMPPPGPDGMMPPPGYPPPHDGGRMLHYPGFMVPRQRLYRRFVGSVHGRRDPHGYPLPGPATSGGAHGGEGPGLVSASSMPLPGATTTVPRAGHEAHAGAAGPAQDREATMHDAESAQVCPQSGSAAEPPVSCARETHLGQRQWLSPYVNEPDLLAVLPPFVLAQRRKHDTRSLTQSDPFLCSLQAARACHEAFSADDEPLVLPSSTVEGIRQELRTVTRELLQRRMEAAGPGAPPQAPSHPHSRAGPSGQPYMVSGEWRNVGLNVHKCFVALWSVANVEQDFLLIKPLLPSFAHVQAPGGAPPPSGWTDPHSTHPWPPNRSSSTHMQAPWPDPSAGPPPPAADPSALHAPAHKRSSAHGPAVGSAGVSSPRSRPSSMSAAGGPQPLARSGSLGRREWSGMLQHAPSADAATLPPPGSHQHNGMPHGAPPPYSMGNYAQAWRQGTVPAPAAAPCASAPAEMHGSAGGGLLASCASMGVPPGPPYPSQRQGAAGPASSDGRPYMSAGPPAGAASAPAYVAPGPARPSVSGKSAVSASVVQAMSMQAHTAGQGQAQQHHHQVQQQQQQACTAAPMGSGYRVGAHGSVAAEVEDEGGEEVHGPPQRSSSSSNPGAPPPPRAPAPVHGYYPPPGPYYRAPPSGHPPSYDPSYYYPPPPAAGYGMRGPPPPGWAPPPVPGPPMAPGYRGAPVPYPGAYGSSSGAHHGAPPGWAPEYGSLPGAGPRVHGPFSGP